MGCPGAAPRQGAAESFAFLCLVTFLPRSSVGMLCRRRDPGRAGVGRFSGTGFSEAGTLHEHVELRPAQRSSRAPPPHPPTEVWGRSGGFGLIPSSKVCICSEASVKDDLNSFTASLHKSECARWKTLCVNPFRKIHLHVELGFGGDRGSMCLPFLHQLAPPPHSPVHRARRGTGGSLRGCALWPRVPESRPCQVGTERRKTAINRNGLFSKTVRVAAFVTFIFHKAGCVVLL